MKLKEYRTAAGLSQSQLAKASGVSVRNIQEYEQGKKDINKAQALTVYKIAQALTKHGDSVVLVHDLLEI